MGRVTEHRGEEGFTLLAMVVAIFLVMLALGVAAPRVAKELRRDREVESMHRGEQYVRAVRVYYRKFGHYPGSIEQLEKTNNIRFLRQKYVDPLTGKADWRIIHVGEAKTTVKGFFGQPLAGIATQGIGSTAGLSSPGTPIGGTAVGGAGGGAAGSWAVGAGSTGTGYGASGAGFGASSTGFGVSSGGTGAGAGAGPGAGAGTAAGAGAGAAAGAGTGAGTVGAQTGSTDALGTAGPFVGVGSSATGGSILELNAQTTYESWEFIYDPRIEQLYAKASLMGGAAPSGGGLGGEWEPESGDRDFAGRYAGRIWFVFAWGPRGAWFADLA